MLEVDLLRGGGKPQNRRAALTLPRADVRGLPLDPWTFGSGLTILASLGLALYLVLSVRGRAAALEEALDAALADSVRGAAVVGKLQTLEARRDSIANKVAIIREIDARRYLWPRIMDEVAGAVPADAWLTSLIRIPSQGDGVRFQVEGLARDNVSLTRFWNGMEASPFIRDVRLVSTENVVAESTADGTVHVYHFVLQAEPEDPPPEMLHLVSFVPGDPR